MSEQTETLRNIGSKESYLAEFTTGRQAALDRAHDIRKFEIELYWKRATYFWAFSAAALAGYLSTSGAEDRTNTLIICCLGFLFSLSWYLVNRGSSYWQRNWEKHVDLLEDSSEGPLHKLVIRREHFRFGDLTGPYRLSPARTNTALSLMFLFLWLALIARTLMRGLVQIPFWQTASVVGIVTAVTAVQMVRRGMTGRVREARAVDMVLREYR